MRSPILLAAITLGVVASSAQAQLNAVPVFYDPSPSSWQLLTIAGYLASGVNDDAGKNFAAGGRVSGNIRRIALAVGVATLNPRVDPTNREVKGQYMISAAFRLLPTPSCELDEVTCTRWVIDGLVGAGRSPVGNGDYQVNVPIGVGVGYLIEFTGFALIPWAAPTYRARWTNIGGLRVRQDGFGISGGINVGATAGLGFYLAIDWATYGAQGALRDIQPFTLGGGVRYRWGDEQR